MLWEDLTPDEQNVVSQHTRDIRKLSGELAVWMETFDVIKANWIAHVDDLVNQLNPDVIIEDGETQRVNAGIITQSELVALQNALGQLETSHGTNPHRQQYVKAAGTQQVYRS